MILIFVCIVSLASSSHHELFHMQAPKLYGPSGFFFFFFFNFFSFFCELESSCIKLFLHIQILDYPLWGDEGTEFYASYSVAHTTFDHLI